MGNCTASQRAAESWADDGEWEEAASSSPLSSEGDHHHRHHHYHRDERREEHHDSEVTIRITKRQLHELMEKNGGGGGHGLPLPGRRRSSAEQLLADIMDSGEVHHRDHHSEDHWHWKPALQSIPETVESS